MKKHVNKKNAVRLGVVGLGLVAVSMLYITGCGGGGGDAESSTCNVPIEASLSNGQAHIGGATTAVELVSIDSVEWTLFNVANELRATKVGMDESNISSIPVKGFIRDIELVTVDGLRYALLAMGDEGIAAVDVTDPSNMMVKTNVSVSYFHEPITWTEGGGDIVPDNNISSARAPISSLVVYNEGNSTDPSFQLIIGDEGYGLHKTSLSNLLNAVPESNLTVDGPEVYTLQYAGENPWGGPKSLKLVGDKLFVAQGFLGMGIYNLNLEQVGRYNLYTDSTEANGGEDWFIDMNVSDQVQSDENGTFLDACTGMPNYKQASFEILDVWHGGTTGDTPWADFDRYGKFYYDARKIDVATFEGKTTAYIAYGLGGMVAVDVTGYDTATARSEDCSVKNNFLEGTYLGYVPGLPAHGPDTQTGEQSKSLFPYFGVGMLKEAGTVDVKVDTATKNVYFSDHFAGLMVIGNADNPANWHGANGAYTYDNDILDPTATLGNHFPDYEFVRSYDMTPVPLGEESVPKFIADDPILLATGEVSGHGNVFALTDTFDQNNSGQIDVVLAAGGGGLNFIDVYNGTEPRYSFDVPVHFATTDEIGADENGDAKEGIINIGHAEGVTSYGNLLFLGDGPHGMSVWNIADENCVPTDDVHLVANTLQSEYPIGDINPAPHAYDVVLDVSNQAALIMSQSRGLRRVTTTQMGTVGAPVLLYPKDTDIFEHNKDEGNVVDFMKMQDHTYGVALKGSLAFTADGSNGLTVYDLSKDPTDATSGYIVSNIGGDTDSKPDLGRATGVALWDGNGKSYAFVASGSAGVGVVDVTDPEAMSLVKVFEPIKIEDGEQHKADGKSVAVKVVGDHAFFTYDSFGIVAYKITDLIAPLLPDTDPTKIWGQQAVDQRPAFVARFKLQDPEMFGWAELAEFSGGAAGMDVVSVGGKNFFYVAYGDAGVIKIDWTNPAAPVLLEHANTVGSALDVSVINGRVYVADGSGGLVLLK